MTRMTGPDCVVMCNLINTHTHTHTHTHPREDQCEWHRMTRMTGPDCVVMCNLINTHTHTHKKKKTQTQTEAAREHKVLRAQVRIVQVERVCPLCRVGSEVFVISVIDPPLGGSMRVA